MFLTNEELHELTGYVRHADQRRWLKDHGWTFEVSATGRPAVLRAFVQTKMGQSSDAPPPWTPNLAALQKAA